MEDEAERDAARTWRRRREDVVAAIGAGDRRRLADRVGGEIFLGENAAIGAARRNDRIGDAAAIEGVGAVIRNQLQRCREIGLDEPVARLAAACHPCMKMAAALLCSANASYDPAKDRRVALR